MGRCLTCDARFYSGQELQWQTHVGRCARQHMDEIQQMRPSVRNKGTMWEPQDPDIEKHFRKVGERMQKEGRKVVLPNERAGLT